MGGGVPNSRILRNPSSCREAGVFEQCDMLTCPPDRLWDTSIGLAFNKGWFSQYTEICVLNYNFKF